GSSRKILINELIKLYDGDELPNISIQYKDYAVWQNKFLKDNLNKQNEEYLLEEFKGELPVLNLPTDYSRPAIKQYDGDICNICIEEELTKKLKDFAIKNNATLFMVILEAISIVLSKYSGQDDIIIGTVTAGRTHADIENIIGLFLNNLAFRCKPIKELGVLEYLSILRNK
ncbi:MAG TPA: polyketide synthase, partial [Clostridium sp.]|nr:polyketide synthase [Clostridium sp.]